MESFKTKFSASRYFKIIRRYNTKQNSLRLYTSAISWNNTRIVHYVRDKNPSIKLQLGTMGVYQYNKHELTAQKCTTAEHNDTVCQIVRYFNGLPQDHDPAGNKATILEFLVPTFNTEQYFHFPLIYCVLLLLVHGDRHPNVMITFNVLSFHRKSVILETDIQMS